MGVSLRKGGNVSLKKIAPSMTKYARYYGDARRLV